VVVDCGRGVVGFTSVALFAKVMNCEIDEKSNPVILSEAKDLLLENSPTAGPSLRSG
jgi:hypothetical protein